MEKDKPEGAAQRGKAAEKGSTEASLNMSELRELADLVDEHGFTDFEFENEKIRVRLSKTVPAPVMAQPAHYAPPPTQAPAMAQPDTADVAVEPVDDLFQITSPIVGTFYRSPGPDKEPYVKEGSSVSPDTVVCIVEAMKLMNEIQAETSGEIVKIYVENGDPVEYGQPLFGIKK
ncbi:MAG TPA: acetyl-CoA carboxylase biotin carboxyl carrier protein [Pyrinomonadaceae bacterium]|nr:acetyl-CoA carboxylase biotin carboxyl carrier protein [Pyrinomonadaceae bacterium]